MDQWVIYSYYNVGTTNCEVLWQNSAPDGGFLARHVALKAGVPIDKPAFAVNRLCGSGFQSIVNGVQVSCVLTL